MIKLILEVWKEFAQSRQTTTVGGGFGCNITAPLDNTSSGITSLLVWKVIAVLIMVAQLEDSTQILPSMAIYVQCTHQYLTAYECQHLHATVPITNTMMDCACSKSRFSKIDFTCETEGGH